MSNVICPTAFKILRTLNFQLANPISWTVSIVSNMATSLGIQNFVKLYTYQRPLVAEYREKTSILRPLIICFSYFAVVLMNFEFPTNNLMPSVIIIQSGTRNKKTRSVLIFRKRH